MGVSLATLGLGVGLEAVEWRDRAEGLLLGDDHVGRHIGQDGRLEEVVAPPLCLTGGAFAAVDDFSALL